MVGGPCRIGEDWTPGLGLCSPEACWGPGSGQEGCRDEVWYGKGTSKNRVVGKEGGWLDRVVSLWGGSADGEWICSGERGQSSLRSGLWWCGISGRARGHPRGSSRCHPPQWTAASHSPGRRTKRGPGRKAPWTPPPPTFKLGRPDASRLSWCHHVCPPSRRHPHYPHLYHLLSLLSPGTLPREGGQWVEMLPGRPPQ